MFYSQFILAKKGPLGTIWIAAHLERKLRKNQVAETDIGVTVDSILFPDVPIALRLSGHLLLGVVRVYSRQVNYLFNDCSETLVKIKQAFRSTAVDLPPEATTAPFHSITLPETFDFDELELLPDSESGYFSSAGKRVDHHVTTREQITLQDNTENNPYLGLSQFELDERFGDGNCSSMVLDFDEEFLAEKAYSGSASASTPLLKEDTIPPLTDDAMQMDIDDPYATFEPQHNSNNIVADLRESFVSRINQNDGDYQDQSSVSPMLESHIHENTSTPYLESPTGPAVVEAVTSTAAYKKDVLNFHTYTPYTEACTPDLNLEFCPPDEPSTPALLDEASFSMCKESSIETQRKIIPGLQENAESNVIEIQPAPLSPNQITLNVISEKSNQQVFSLGPSSPTLGLHHADVVDSVTRPSSPFVEGEASCERTELGPTSHGFTFDSDSAAEVSKNAVVQTFPNEDDGMNQVVTVSGSEAQFSSPGPICQEFVPNFQLHVTTSSLQSSSQNTVQDSIGSPQHQTVENDLTGQAFPSVQEGAMISVSEAIESSSVAHARAADISFEPSTTADDGNATRDLVWLDVADVPQCETLRSISECPKERSGTLLLENNIMDENIPALELENVKSGTGNNIVTVHPELDETPVLKDQTPQTAPNVSPLSAGYLNYLPGDDDVLASILGRRKSSVFKVAPTPTENVIVKKRKVASRSLSKKRRSDFDTFPVLHGDVIRQQLANTEDIRRERRKAPCTRREVWCFNKEVEGQQHFGEPSIPGLSNELHDLFEDVLDGSGSRNMLLLMDSGNSIEEMKSAGEMNNTNNKDMPSLPTENRDSIKDDCENMDRSSVEDLPNQLGGSTENIPEIPNENSERCQSPTSIPQETEHYEGEFPSINHDYSLILKMQDSDIAGQLETVAELPSINHDDSLIQDMQDSVIPLQIGTLEEFASINHDDSLIQNMQDSDIPESIETLAKEDHDDLRPDKCQQEDFVNTALDEGANTVNAQCSPKRMDNGSNENIDVNASEDRMLVEATLVNAEDDMQRTSPQSIIQSVDQADVINNDELALQESLPDPEKDVTNLLIVKCQEHVDVQDISETHLESRENDQIPAVDDASKEKMHTPNSDDEHSGFMGNAGNTDFLADDEDMENAEIYEDSGDEQRDTSVLENSGWSVRSRNVGRYLKSVFEEMEGTCNRMHQEHPTLGLERLLASKTRKEAARMFFETLVLKTRDYIHVEQKLPYEDIHLYSRPKLMKNTF